MGVASSNRHRRSRGLAARAVFEVPSKQRLHPSGRIVNSGHCLWAIGR